MTGKSGTGADRGRIMITGSMITPIWLLLFLATLAVLAALGGMFLLGIIWDPHCTLASYAAHGQNCH